jgi:hypothetical protein
MVGTVPTQRGTHKPSRFMPLCFADWSRWSRIPAATPSPSFAVTCPHR